MQIISNINLTSVLDLLHVVGIVLFLDFKSDTSTEYIYAFISCLRFAAEDGRVCRRITWSAAAGSLHAASHRAPTGSLITGMRAHARHDWTERGRWSSITGLLLIDVVGLLGGA